MKLPKYVISKLLDNTNLRVGESGPRFIASSGDSRHPTVEFRLNAKGKRVKGEEKKAFSMQLDEQPR